HCCKNTRNSALIKLSIEFPAQSMCQIIVDQRSMHGIGQVSDVHIGPDQRGLHLLVVHSEMVKKRLICRAVGDVKKAESLRILLFYPLPQHMQGVMADRPHDDQNKACFLKSPMGSCPFFLFFVK